MARGEMGHKTYRAVKEVVEELGCELLEVKKTKRHFKVYVRAAKHERFFVLSVSPSDSRSLQNWRSDIRRWLFSLPGGVTGRRS